MKKSLKEGNRADCATDRKNRDQDLPNGIPIQNVSQTAKIMLGYKSDDKNDPGLHLRESSTTCLSAASASPRVLTGGSCARRVDAGDQRLAVPARAQLGRL